MPARVITAVPDLLRVLVSPISVDEDWVADQELPEDYPASAIVDVGLSSPVYEIGVIATAVDGSGDPITGSVDLQLIEITTAQDTQDLLGEGAEAKRTLIVGSFVQEDQPTAGLSVLPGKHLRRFTVRVAGASAEVLAAAELRLDWRAIDR